MNENIVENLKTVNSCQSQKDWLAVEYNSFCYHIMSKEIIQFLSNIVLLILMIVLFILLQKTNRLIEDYIICSYKNMISKKD